MTVITIIDINGSFKMSKMSSFYFYFTFFTIVEKQKKNLQCTLTKYKKSVFRLNDKKHQTNLCIIFSIV